LPLRLVAFFIALGAPFGPLAHAEELSVHFKTTPRPELLRPFADPTDIVILVTGADGRPVEAGTVAIRLDAPPPRWFFSTDYALVEGTVLNEMRLPLHGGKAGWKHLLPIRGEYRLTVDVAASDGRKSRRVFPFHVRENQGKWLALGAFSIGLFFLGFVAGRIFTGSRGAVFLSAPVFLLASANASAQFQASAGAAWLKIAPATVGRPSEIRWDFAGVNTGAAVLSLTITHLEKQKTVFALDKLPVAGDWSMIFHFPDGAEYRVSATAAIPGAAPVVAEEIISVTGVAPPAGAIARALAYFIGLIVLGLAAGRWSKRRQTMTHIEAR
jgi:hypothetical protein